METLLKSANSKEEDDVEGETEVEPEKTDDSLFEDLMVAVGNDGAFQKRSYIIFNAIVVGFMSMAYLNLILAMSVPEHHCHVPGRNETLYTLQEWQAKMLPMETDPKTGVEAFSSCQMFSNGTNTEKCSHGWDYDRTWFVETAPTMQNWVCDRELYVTNTFVATIAGEIFSHFFMGQLADRIGRKPVFYISLALLLIGRTLSVFTSHIYPLFLVSVFMAGSAATAVFQTPLVLSMEISAVSKRSQVVFIQYISWMVGSCAVPMLTWLIGDWQNMMLVTTLPCASAFLLHRMLPESSRWLASRGRVTDSAKVLSYIAKVNGTSLPHNTYEILEKIAKQKEKIYGMPSLFANKRLAKNTLIILVCWVACGFSNYALIINVSNMAGNPFMNFFWQALVEIPSYAIGNYLSNRVGRRWTHTSSYAIIVLMCAAVIITHGRVVWLTTVLVTFIKFGVTLAFYTIYLQAMEVFPTCVRQTGCSMGNVISDIFELCGPYVVYLGMTVDARLPYVAFLCLALLGAICSSMLPETLNKKLPETLEDAKNFGDNQHFWSFNITEKLPS